MTVDRSQQSAWAAMQAAAGRIHHNEPQPLSKGGGGGTSGGMEARIAKLESDMEHVKKSVDRLVNVPVDLATLKATMDTLPDKDWVGTKMRNWVGGMGVLLAGLMIAFKFIH